VRPSTSRSRWKGRPDAEDPAEHADRGRLGAGRGHRREGEPDVSLVGRRPPHLVGSAAPAQGRQARRRHRHGQRQALQALRELGAVDVTGNRCQHAARLHHRGVMAAQGVPRQRRQRLRRPDDRPRQRVVAPRRTQHILLDPLRRIILQQLELGERDPPLELDVLVGEAGIEDRVHQQLETLDQSIDRGLHGDAHQLRAGPRVDVAAQPVDQPRQGETVAAAAPAQGQVLHHVGCPGQRTRLVGRSGGEPDPGRDGGAAGRRVNEEGWDIETASAHVQARSVTEQRRREGGAAESPVDPSPPCGSY